MAQKKEEKSTEKRRPSSISSDYHCYAPTPYIKQTNEGNDPYRALELKEMEEEEKYIQMLRLQREKIESFKQQVQNKDLKIKQLQEELNHSSVQKQNTHRLAGENEKLQEELKAKELENEELRESMRKQVEEYEYSLYELNQVVLKEREDKNKEIKQLKTLLKQKDTQTHSDSEENSKLKQKVKTLQEKLDSEVKSSQDKDKQADEQLKVWKSFERMLKDQVSELAYEKSVLEQKLKESKEAFQEEHQRASDVYEIQNTLNLERRKNEELKKILSERDQEISNLRQDYSKYQFEEELQAMQEELNRAFDLITRQEKTIKDLRLRKQEDDYQMDSLKEEAGSQKNEVERLLNQNSRLNKDIEEYYSNITSLEAELNLLRTEHNSLKKKLQSYNEKDQQERAERQYLAKMKLNLLNQRTSEISKLSDALECFSEPSVNK